MLRCACRCRCCVRACQAHTRASSHSDSQNVAKVANYIRAHASERMQFIVISLKASLYERAQALAGVYRDQAVGASATLTLELERYA